MAEHADIDEVKCMGCGQCYALCREGAVRFDWKAQINVMQERIAEVTLGIVQDKPGKIMYANVAVHVNEDYQVIFPPSTQYGTHHHKREFIKWPIADARYGGWDFSDGVDVSWFKNHISANSIFAWNYVDDFVAGYDHGKKAGTMAVANHHIVPGKKLWTWGNGPEAR